MPLAQSKNGDSQKCITRPLDDRMFSRLSIARRLRCPGQEIIEARYQIHCNCLPQFRLQNAPAARLRGF